MSRYSHTFDEQKQKKSAPRISEYSDDQPSGLAKGDEPIWGFSSLDKAKFYAAALFLDEQTFRHETSQSSLGSDAEDNSVIYQRKTRLLDHLAFLFARFKKPKMQLKDTSSSGQNVTATALHISAHQDGQAAREKWNICISKNGGPQKFDGWDDVDFAKKLEAWYGGLTSVSLPSKEHEVWTLMQEFWARRSCFYCEQLCKIRQSWVSTFSGPMALLESLDRVFDYGSDKRRWKYVISDVKHAWELLMVMDRDRGCNFDNEADVKEYSRYIWFEDTGFWRSKYPKLDITEFYDHQAAEALTRKAGQLADESAERASMMKIAKLLADNAKKAHKLAEEFRKAVKYLVLLRIPISTVEDFLHLRAELPDMSINISFEYPPAEMPDLEMKPIAAAAKNFAEDEDQNQAFKSDLKDFTKSLAQSSKIHRQFHCELQLLSKFLGSDDVHDYFGCSKASCFLCWAVLCGSRYRTKGTHQKLYACCAFPFRFLEEHKAQFIRLANQLKKRENFLVSQMQSKGLNPDYQKTRNKPPKGKKRLTTRTQQSEQLHLTANTAESESDPDYADEEERLFLEAQNTKNLIEAEAAAPKLTSHSLVISEGKATQKLVKAIKIPLNGSPIVCTIKLYEIYSRHPSMHEQPAQRLEFSRFLPLEYNLDGNPLLHGNQWWVASFVFNELDESVGLQGRWVRLDLGGGFFADSFDTGDSDFNNRNFWCLQAYQDCPLTGDIYLFRVYGSGVADFHIHRDSESIHSIRGYQRLLPPDLELSLAVFRIYLDTHYTGMQPLVINNGMDDYASEGNNEID